MGLRGKATAIAVLMPAFRVCCAARVEDKKGSRVSSARARESKPRASARAACSEISESLLVSRWAFTFMLVGSRITVGIKLEEKIITFTGVMQSEGEGRRIDRRHPVRVSFSL